MHSINILKKLPLWGLGGFILLFFSCSESDGDDTEYADWEIRNDNYFESVYDQAQVAIKSGDSLTWKIIRAYSKAPSTQDKGDHIVVKVLNKGTGTISPVQTDSVYIHYRGNLMPSASYPSGYQFDSSWTGDYNLNIMTPYISTAGGFIDGFSTALLNMHTGDRWLVYIPSDLGYGASETTSIPAYSTLVFDITLAKIKNK